MSTYKVQIHLPQVWQSKKAGRQIDRAQWVEEWSSRLLTKSQRFLGAIEGSALVSQSIYDIAEAPAARDLVRDLESSLVTFYFSEPMMAEAFKMTVMQELPFHSTARIEVEVEKDWNKSWKESFQGVELSPDWHILPEWKRSATSSKSKLRPIYINPGMGFGSGEHATTALCLRAIGKFQKLSESKVLDFGTGSGILAIAAALKGATVDAVEIDKEALQNAADCIRLNSVQDQISLVRDLTSLPKDQSYDLVVANILSPVLIEFSSNLVDRMKPQSCLILSGLLRDQVDEIIETYRPLFNQHSVSIEYQGEWTAVIFQIWKPAGKKISQRPSIRRYFERWIESR